MAQKSRTQDDQKQNAVQSQPITGNKKTNGFLFPLALGLLFTIGNSAAQTGTIPIKTPRFWMTAVFFIALFTLTFAGVYRLLDRAGSSATGPTALSFQGQHVRTGHRPFWKFEWRLTAPAIARDALRLLVCWTPMAILMYPGMRGMDASEMIGSYLGYPALGQPAGVIWLHHPWFDTVFYGAAVKASIRLTGSINLGLFAICLLQALVAAAGFSLALAWFASKRVSHRILTGFALFIAFFPLIPYVVFNINKDMTFATFLTLYGTLIFIILDGSTQDRILRNPWFNLLYLLLSVIVSQTVKSGVIIITGTAILLLFTTRSWRRRLLAAMSAITVLLFANVVAPLAIYPRLHAVKGNVSAGLVAPIQMMARTAHLHPHELTPTQEHVFRTYFTSSWQQFGQRYNPFLVDMVISPIGRGARAGRPSKQVIRLWAREGRKHPLEYAESYLLLESGWYSFATVGSKPDTKWMVGVRENIFNPNLIVEYDALSQHYGPVEETWRGRIFRDVYLALASVPGLNLPAMLAFYQSILPAFALYVLWRRRHRLGGRGLYTGFAACSLWLLVIAATWFAAVSQGIVSSSASRYVYPSLYLSPLILLFLIDLMGKTSQRIRKPVTQQSSLSKNNSLSHRPAIN